MPEIDGTAFDATGTALLCGLSPPYSRCCWYLDLFLDILPPQKYLNLSRSRFLRSRFRNSPRNKGLQCGGVQHRIAPLPAFDRDAFAATDNRLAPLPNRQQPEQCGTRDVA